MWRTQNQVRKETWALIFSRSRLVSIQALEASMPRHVLLTRGSSGPASIRLVTSMTVTFLHFQTYSAPADWHIFPVSSPANPPLSAWEPFCHWHDFVYFSSDSPCVCCFYRFLKTNLIFLYIFKIIFCCLNVYVLNNLHCSRCFPWVSVSPQPDMSLKCLVMGL